MPLSQVAVSCFPFGFDKLLLRNATGPAGNSWFTTFFTRITLCLFRVRVGVDTDKSLAAPLSKGQRHPHRAVPMRVFFVR